MRHFTIHQREDRAHVADRISGREQRVKGAGQDRQVGPGTGVEVECVIDSGDVGVSKPDPRIFRIALEAMALHAADVWYVGDTPAIDVTGARAAGLVPIVMDPYHYFGTFVRARLKGLTCTDRAHSLRFVA